ncbi:transcriptional regulator, LacI family [Devosia enhydra]|uniref:Transcriptional regulator, LacI family n=1 Tax=Devosia enhydra TaxID=665118 RepID=A0A1K2HVX2_9HYPH|nr:LacI family DNA-binding transcriptional regulator [Devosia enhydra]SFZ83025.1 transcriptional regulator, LacI family [Devosia enhydra]
MTEDRAPRRRLTSKDVAAHAGVSQSVVSFYFTGKRPVGEDARKRIETAIAELDYRPNRVAQSLRTRSTGQIAVFIPYISNPIYAAFAAGAEIALAKAGYLTVIFSNREVPAQVEAYFDMVADSRVDGLLLFPFQDDVARIEKLRATGIPIVFVDRTVPIAPKGRPIDSVVVDNEGAVRNAIAHLLRQGHRRIGFISSANATFGTPRLEGYKKAFADLGLVPPPEYIALGGGRVEDGFRMASQLLADVPDMTALMVSVNMPTLGALDAVHRAGLAVPDQISFIGYDSDDDTHRLPERIAAIRYPAMRLGQEAAEMLVRRLREEGDAPGRATQMGPDLYLGASTRAL